MRADAVKPVERDERTEVVENQSYRWGYIVATFGMLLAVMYRAYFLSDPAWDLMGLVVASGLTVTVIQARGRILGRRWVLLVLLIVLGAAAVAAGMTMLFGR